MPNGTISKWPNASNMKLSSIKQKHHISLYPLWRVALRFRSSHSPNERRPQKLMESHFEIDNLPNFTINCDFISKMFITWKTRFELCCLQYCTPSVSVLSPVNAFCMLAHFPNMKWECVSAVYVVQSADNISGGKQIRHRNVWRTASNTRHLKSKLCLFKI